MLIEELSTFSEEAETEARWVLQYLGFSSYDVRFQPEKKLSAGQQTFVQDVLKRRRLREPLQHILGTQPFRYLELEVNPQVLIPRPETEELVQRVLDYCGDNAFTVADIGTGSGAIAIALKTERPQLQVHATDIHLSALNVARRNAQQHQADIYFSQGDGLRALPDMAFDVIVSNPPYIPHSEKSELAPEVCYYEPHAALFPESDDALFFYRHFATEAPYILKPDGAIFLEIHAPLAQQTLALFNNSDWQRAKIYQDLQNKPRFVVAHAVEPQI